MFDAFGTEGLNLFTWIVAGLLGIVTALITTHALGVFNVVGKEDEEADEEQHVH